MSIGFKVRTMTVRSSTPLVAIVTPVYNGEKYLAETMECVQSLDYANLIHIVLDNASTDASPEIISRYRGARVPIVARRNDVTLPLISNFNAAVALVPQEAAYFRLLCADDTMAPNAISRQVEVAERDPDIGIVGCCCRGQRYGGLPKDREIFDGGEIMRLFLRREHFGLAGTEVLVRRSQLDKQPFFYDPTFRGAADTDANLRICLDSKFGFVHEELAMWRQHELSEFAALSRSYFNVAEWLVLLRRYGPIVLTDREYREHRSWWRRIYLRRLLLIRWRNGDRTSFIEHMSRLRQQNDPASLLDFADAVFERGLRLLTRRHMDLG